MWRRWRQRAGGGVMVSAAGGWSRGGGVVAGRGASAAIARGFCGRVQSVCGSQQFPRKQLRHPARPSCPAAARPAVTYAPAITSN